MTLQFAQLQLHQEHAVTIINTRFWNWIIWSHICECPVTNNTITCCIVTQNATY